MKRLLLQAIAGLSIIGLVLFLIVIIIGIGTYLYFLPTIYNKTWLVNRNNTGLVLQDQKGEPFFSFYNAKHEKYITADNISDHVEDAVVAAEDKEFYYHHGFSVKGILRAAYLDFKNQSLSYGGSTLTQQLVKNALLSPKRNFLRKFQEVVLAYEIENKYSKKEILEMYLNSVYFGKGAFGIEDAAKTYFGKSADKLDLAESSYLVGLLTSPSTLSRQTSESGLAKERQTYVLDQMEKDDMITEQDRQKALVDKLAFSTEQEDINSIAPHYALLIRDMLIKKYGEEQIVRSGFTVKTTLNREFQEYAEGSVQKHVAQLAGDNVTNGAAVVMDAKTGEVLAMVGSANWYNDQFGKVNMATTPRQPGSSFKPFVYGLAFESGEITPATVLMDIPKTFKQNDCYTDCEYKPKDYDGKFRGRVLVRRALANSLNIPAVEVMEKVGVEPVLTKAKVLGIDTLGPSSDYGLSLVLGTGEVPLVEMVNAYSSFANYGTRPDPVYFTEIYDKRGSQIYSSQAKTTQVWSSKVAFLISSILSDNRARAEEFGSALTINRPAAVKTGTTEDYRDAWTVGYTPDLVVGVWVGNNDNRPMDRIAGSLGAAPIWRDLMEHVNEGLAVKTFEPPGDVVKVAICSSNGGKVTSATSSAIMEYFVQGTQPTKSCTNMPGLDIAASGSGQTDGFEAGVGGAPPTETPGVSPEPENQDQEVEIKDHSKNRVFRFKVVNGHRVFD